ncbi:MAG: HD domain-containing protein [Candidatus Omnitrophota bacterium]
MLNFKTCAQSVPYLSTLAAVARSHDVYVWLVGGVLRDMYLGKKREFFDFDFCVEKHVLPVVKHFAKKTSSRFIVLDEAQQSYRVIVKQKGAVYTYDFTLMRGAQFIDDLARRDFSINTLALCLNEKGKLLDYYGARRDLKRKIIRVIQEDVFEADPLRILRGFSFMVNYGLRIEKRTYAYMIKYRKLLKAVSGERLKEEFFKILGAPGSFRAIKQLADAWILDEIIPSLGRMRGVTQGAYHHLDVWAHSLETLRQFERLVYGELASSREITAYLNESLAQNRTRNQVIKLACLLHDIGKPAAKARKGKRTIFYTHEKIGRDLIEHIASALKFSVRVREFLKKLVFWHLRPGYLADQEEPTRRAIYRFFRDTQEEGPSVVLLSLADWRATCGPLTDARKRKRHEKVMLSLVEDYFREIVRIPLPVIVDGFAIMKKFNLSPSPLIGKILKKVREEQALGHVTTKTQAYVIAHEIVTKNREGVGVPGACISKRKVP